MEGVAVGGRGDCYPKEMGSLDTGTALHTMTLGSRQTTVDTADREITAVEQESLLTRCLKKFFFLEVMLTNHI